MAEHVTDSVTQANLDKFSKELKELKEAIPPIVWTLYQGFLEQGFDADQSFELCKAYVQSSFGKSGV